MKTLLPLAALLACAAFIPASTAGADEPPTCQGAPATIVADGSGPVFGTAGPDVIVGTTGADTIYAGDGDDLICGAPDGATTDGGDTHFAGDGADLVTRLHSTDQEKGGPALDQNPNTDTCAGGRGDNQLFFCEL